MHRLPCCSQADLLPSHLSTGARSAFRDMPSLDSWALQATVWNVPIIVPVRISAASTAAVPHGRPIFQHLRSCRCAMPGTHPRRVPPCMSGTELPRPAPPCSAVCDYRRPWICKLCKTNFWRTNAKTCAPCPSKCKVCGNVLGKPYCTKCAPGHMAMRGKCVRRISLPCPTSPQWDAEKLGWTNVWGTNSAGKCVKVSGSGCEHCTWRLAWPGACLLITRVCSLLPCPCPCSVLLEATSAGTVNHAMETRPRCAPPAPTTTAQRCTSMVQATASL